MQPIQYGQGRHAKIAVLPDGGSSHMADIHEANPMEVAMNHYDHRSPAPHAAVTLTTAEFLAPVIHELSRAVMYLFDLIAGLRRR